MVDRALDDIIAESRPARGGKAKGRGKSSSGRGKGRGGGGGWGKGGASLDFWDSGGLPSSGDFWLHDDRVGGGPFDDEPWEDDFDFRKGGKGKDGGWGPIFKGGGKGNRFDPYGGPTSRNPPLGAARRRGRENAGDNGGPESYGKWKHDLFDSVDNQSSWGFRGSGKGKKGSRW